MQQNQPVPGRPLSRLASLFQRGPPAPTPAPAPAPAPTQPLQPPPLRPPIRLPSFPRPPAPLTTAPPPQPAPTPAPQVEAPPPPVLAPAPVLEVEALPPLRPIQTRPPAPSPPQVTPPQTPPVPSPKPAQTQVLTTQRQTSPRPAPPSPKPAQTQVSTTQRQTSPKPAPSPPPSPKPAQTQVSTTQRQTSPKPAPPSPSAKPEISQATTQPQASPKPAWSDYAQPWTATLPQAPTSTPVPTSPKSAVQPPASLRPRAVPYRSLTPPQSPKIIKPSEPTPPPSPKTIQQQPKSIFSQYKNGNGNSKVTSDKKEPPVEKNGTHLSPKKGDGVTDGKIANNSTMPSGKKIAEKSKEEEQTGWRLITIAGENMGAYMELGSGYQKLQKQQPAGTIFKYQHNSKISEVQENEPRSDMKESVTVSKGRPLAALVNSNVQAINNSMVFNSSCAHKSPGVHLNVSSHRLPTGTSSSNPKKGE